MDQQLDRYLGLCSVGEGIGSMTKQEKCLVSVDVGSSKVGVLIGKPGEDGEIEVVGQGEASNRGTRRGNIVNVEATVAALRRATEEAEMMAGYEVESAYVGVAGNDIRSVNSRAMVSVSRKDREIRPTDIQRVLEASQAAALPSDREILHAIPQEFVVDDQGGISDPLGMLGSRLEVSVHLVTGHTTRSKTLLTCVNKAGIRVRELVFEPLASAEAVLRDEERDRGVLLIDIGSGTSGYALYAEGEVQHSGVSPIGASHFTNDLAQVLRTPFEEAERLKVRSGSCLQSLIGDEEGISVPAIGGGATHVVRRRELCEILQPRAEELFGLILEDLHRVGRADSVRGGIVLTGGGAQLNGLLELSEQMFGSAARYGLPERFRGLSQVIESPTWSAAAGLLRYAWIAETAPGRKRERVSVRSVVNSLRGMFTDLL